EHARADGTDLDPGEARELTAQFRIDLDRGPDLVELREFWERADALDSGVLTNGAGVKELVTAASAAQAYRVVTGKFEETDKQTVADSAKSSISVEVMSQLKDLLQPLAAIAVAFGVGKAVADLGSVTSVL